MIENPQTFEMTRRADESGVSGTGVVLHGCVFPDGTTTVRWAAGAAGVASTVVYASYADFLQIHVRPHPTNGTQIEWGDGRVETYTDALQTPH